MKRVGCKTEWNSKVPDEEGWYWVKYVGKRGVVVCPAEVYHFRKCEPHIAVIHTARNDIVTEGRLDGMKFGPEIPFPK
jgi:hypothetical protein